MVRISLNSFFIPIIMLSIWFLEYVFMTHKFIIRSDGICILNQNLPWIEQLILAWYVANNSVTTCDTIVGIAALTQDKLLFVMLCPQCCCGVACSLLWSWASELRICCRGLCMWSGAVHCTPSSKTKHFHVVCVLSFYLLPRVGSSSLPLWHCSIVKFDNNKSVPWNLLADRNVSGWFTFMSLFGMYTAFLS